jgi:hypothetical protein
MHRPALPFLEKPIRPKTSISSEKPNSQTSVMTPATINCPLRLAFGVDDGHTVRRHDASTAEERPAPWCCALAGLVGRTWYID